VKADNTAKINEPVKPGGAYIAVVRLADGRYMAMLDDQSCLRTWTAPIWADKELRNHPLYHLGFSYYEMGS
jgi:hypothetical protein